MGANQYNYPFHNRFKYIYIFIFFLFLSIVIMTAKSHNLETEYFWVKGIIEIINPVHKGILGIYNGISNVWNNYIYLVNTQKENYQLQQEIEKLKSYDVKYKEIKLSNERLTKLLKFKQHLNFPIIAAQIIGKDSTSWFQTVLIDKGSTSDIKINQPVVTNQGLVGKLVRVTPYTSLVQLITDKNSHVAAIIQKNRVEGILVGQSQNNCILKYIERDADIQIGDSVISSGMGGIFPKGLMLGVITSIDKKPYGLFQCAEVSPKVLFSRLEEVLVLQK